MAGPVRRLIRTTYAASGSHEAQNIWAGRAAMSRVPVAATS